MKIKLIVISIISFLLLSACSGQDHSSNHADEQHSDHPPDVTSDIREETQSVNVIPDFLNEKPEEMKLIYTAAASHKDLLENIPCYCGCGDSVNHKNNYDCFVNESKENGAIVWDDHGTKCGVCLEIAAQSILDYKDGKTIEEIRAKVDNTYKEGYAKPTPTPEV